MTCLNALFNRCLKVKALVCARRSLLQILCILLYIDVTIGELYYLHLLTSALRNIGRKIIKNKFHLYNLHQNNKQQKS